jgi:hypothetical protein
VFWHLIAKTEWQSDIVDGLPDPIVMDSFIEGGDKPGLGLTINAAKAKKCTDDSPGIDW